MLCGIFAATQIGKLPPAIPALREAFGASLVQMGWVASIFNLVAACGGLATGIVADRFGRRTLLKAGLALLGFGALTGVTGDGLPMLFVSRIVEGLGFKTFNSSSFKLKSEATFDKVVSTKTLNLIDELLANSFFSV